MEDSTDLSKYQLALTEGKIPERGFEIAEYFISKKKRFVPLEEIDEVFDFYYDFFTRDALEILGNKGYIEKVFENGTIKGFALK